MADSNDEQRTERGFTALKEHVSQHKIDVALWASRILTVLYTLGYLFPIFGNSTNTFYKVLLANAATSALRLHQRLPPVSFSKEYFALLLVEDSCHYLLFSIIFMYVSPFIFILMPIVLFAVLHAASYSLTLLDKLGQNNWCGARLMISLVELQTTSILRLAALAEILLMPFAIICVFLNRASLMTPFMYYHFLVLRYSSRRNPYNRNAFHELRLATEALANGQRLPPIFKKFLHISIKCVERLAPTMTPVQQ